MFLKAFKEKSNQKYINKLLRLGKPEVKSTKVTTIAVLLNSDEYSDFEAFRNYFKRIGLNSPRHKIIAFTPDDKFEGSQWETYFSPKDFGWHGKINHVELQSFLQEEFDVLISYFTEDNLYMKWITAASKANLKVGLSRKDERLYDLIISIEPENFSTFKTEFKKYLMILKKL